MSTETFTGVFLGFKGDKPFGFIRMDEPVTTTDNNYWDVPRARRLLLLLLRFGARARILTVAQTIFVHETAVMENIKVGDKVRFYIVHHHRPGKPPGH